MCSFIISISFIYNTGGKVTFRKQIFSIIFDDKITLIGARDQASGLWLLPLQQSWIAKEVEYYNSSHNKNVRSDNVISSVITCYPNSVVESVLLETTNTKNS